MVLSQLRSLVLDYCDDPQGSYFTSTIVNLRLNLAMWELQKRLISANKEYYTICVKTSTVAGQQNYALPTNFYQIVRLEWYNTGTSATSLSNKILPMTPNQRDLLVTVTGDPQYYSLAKGPTAGALPNIVLWPIPDRIVEMHLEYNYLIDFMINDGDTPDVPAQFVEYLPVLATRDCLIKDGRPLAPIETKLQDYQELLKQIAVQRQADVPRMVVQTGGEWNW